MTTGDDFGQVTELHARVDFRRRQAAMPQELLDLADVGPAFQQVSRTSVSQRVRRDVLLDAGSGGRLAHDAHNVIVIKWPTGTSRDEQTHLAGFLSEDAARFFQVEFQSGDRALRHWHDAGGVAIAVFYSERRGLQVGVVDR